MSTHVEVQDAADAPITAATKKPAKPKSFLATLAEAAKVDHARKVAIEQRRIDDALAAFESALEAVDCKQLEKTILEWACLGISFNSYRSDRSVVVLEFVYPINVYQNERSRDYADARAEHIQKRYKAVAENWHKQSQFSELELTIDGRYTCMHPKAANQQALEKASEEQKIQLKRTYQVLLTWDIPLK